MQISVSEPELGGRSEGDEAKFHSPAEYVFFGTLFEFSQIPQNFSISDPDPWRCGQKQVGENFGLSSKKTAPVTKKVN